MNASLLNELNEEFGLGSNLQFTQTNGLVYARVKNRFAEFGVFLHGAHVASFTPHGKPDILWVSTRSRFRDGYPIRGGIPVCWPWFGNHPTDSDKANHGFARLMEWRVSATDYLDPDDIVRISLTLSSDDRTRAIWPYDFHVRSVLSFGTHLEVELITENTGNSPFTFSSALHSYFNVSDVRKITISGLEDCTYSDSIDHRKEKRQEQQIVFKGEVDRVYLNTANDCVITDPGYEREIRVSKKGSNTTVVWNPWIDKSRRMPDFGDDEYLTMVCVETANARSDCVTLSPGMKHSVKAIIR